MESKRKRILTMLEDGTITTEEALTLLEKLGQSQVEPKVEPKKKTPEVNKEAQQPVNEEKTTKKETNNDGQPEPEPSNDDKADSEPSMEEFLDDLRKDFTNVGDRFMQFMQSAVQKVKEFDFDSPFGQGLTFNHSITKPATGIEEVLIDIDNGKVAIHRADVDEIRAEFTVKTQGTESEEEAKEAFIEKLLFVTDGDKLRVSSDMKFTKVNMELYIPKKMYTKLSARLMNGSFQMKDAEFETVCVKTANGKVEVSSLQFRDAEFETANGSINLTNITGEKLDAETLNGRVYIDGELVEVEAKSLNGHVAVTTSNSAATKIEAKTISGSVEIYIPVGISLSGEIASNVGRLDLRLDDVDRTVEQEQLLQRTIRFKKDVAGSSAPLHLFGEAKTGTVLVCYNAKKE